MPLPEGQVGQMVLNVLGWIFRCARHVVSLPPVVLAWLFNRRRWVPLSSVLSVLLRFFLVAVAGRIRHAAASVMPDRPPFNPSEKRPYRDPAPAAAMTHITMQQVHCAEESGFAAGWQQNASRCGYQHQRQRELHVQPGAEQRVGQDARPRPARHTGPPVSPSQTLLPGPR